MPITGLLVVCHDERGAREALANRLAEAGGFTLGAPIGNRLPMALDSVTREADIELLSWLQAQPEVDHVQIAFIHFDEPADTPDTHLEAGPCSSNAAN